MQVYRAVVIIALLAGPSVGHAQMPSMNLIPELTSKSPEEKEAEEARQKAYRDSLKKIPDAKVSSDPWGVVRSADTPKTDASKTDASKTAASKTAAPAKPRTKTGSSTN